MRPTERKGTFGAFGSADIGYGCEVEIELSASYVVVKGIESFVPPVLIFPCMPLPTASTSP